MQGQVALWESFWLVNDPVANLTPPAQTAGSTGLLAYMCRKCSIFGTFPRDASIWNAPIGILSLELSHWNYLRSFHLGFSRWILLVGTGPLDFFHWRSRVQMLPLRILPLELSHWNTLIGAFTWGFPIDMFPLELSLWTFPLEVLPFKLF